MVFALVCAKIDFVQDRLLAALDITHASVVLFSFAQLFGYEQMNLFMLSLAQLFGNSKFKQA